VGISFQPNSLQTSFVPIRPNSPPSATETRFSSDATAAGAGLPKPSPPSPLGFETAHRGCSSVGRIHRLAVFDLPGRSASGDDFRHVQRRHGPRPLPWYVVDSSSTLTFSLPPLCRSSGSTRPRWLPMLGSWEELCCSLA
jgi:hypothetical protein